MSLQLDIRAESDFLDITATGKFTLREAERTFLEVLEAVVLHKTQKVLLDGRKVTGNPAAMERFFYGKFAANSVKAYKDRGVSPATAFAYVLKVPMLDPKRFGETVAVNRGMNVRVFDNPQAAYKWLELESPRMTAAGKCA